MATQGKDQPNTREKQLFHYEDIISHFAHTTTSEFNKKFKKDASTVQLTKNEIREQAWEERANFLLNHVHNITCHPNKYEHFNYVSNPIVSKTKATRVYKNIIRSLQPAADNTDIHRLFIETFDNLAQEDAKEATQLYMRIALLDNL